MVYSLASRRDKRRIYRLAKHLCAQLFSKLIQSSLLSIHCSYIPRFYALNVEIRKRTNLKAGQDEF